MTKKTGNTRSSFFEVLLCFSLTHIDLICWMSCSIRLLFFSISCKMQSVWMAKKQKACGKNAKKEDFTWLMAVQRIDGSLVSLCRGLFPVHHSGFDRFLHTLPHVVHDAEIVLGFRVTLGGSLLEQAEGFIVLA